MGGKLLKYLRAELSRLADPKKAPQMQRYMKSAMPFHGVPAPLVKITCKHHFSQLSWENALAWQKDVLDLWQGAKFREERYCALNLVGHKNARAFQTPRLLPLFENLIVSGAWWDFVDEIAIRRIGPLLADYPEIISKKMLSWSQDPNLWKRRSAIICQISFKEKTDLDLPYACIKPSLASDEFFLRKGIGWALRQVAWSRPKEIQSYVAKHQKILSPLSIREALKNINRGSVKI